MTTNQQATDGHTQPHDSLARYVFSRPADMADELRNGLHPEVIKQLDLDSLENLPASFIDNELKATHSDFLVRVPYAANPGSSAYVYALVEHQSRRDRHMPQRMTRAILGVWDHVRHNYPLPDDRLPLVIPVVLHHGAHPWLEPTSISDCLDPAAHQADLADYGLRLELIIDDLRTLTDAQLLQRQGSIMARYATIMFIRGTSDTFLDLMDQAAMDSDEELDGDDVTVSLRYLFSITNTETVDDLYELIAGYPNLEKTMNTYVEESLEFLRNDARKSGHKEGREQGREEGREQGREEGRTEALREMLLEQLQTKFGDVSELERQAVADATVNQLSNWCTQVLTAGSVEQALEVRHTQTQT